MKKQVFFIIIIFMALNGCRESEEEPSSVAGPAGDYVESVVLSPAERDIIYKGTEMDIQWKGFKTQRVRIELWKKRNYYFQLISAGQVNTGSCRWLVPPGTESSVSYQVKIVNPDNDNDFIFSGVFTIR